MDEVEYSKEGGNISLNNALEVKKDKMCSMDPKCPGPV